MIEFAGAAQLDDAGGVGERRAADAGRERGNAVEKLLSRGVGRGRADLRERIEPALLMIEDRVRPSVASAVVVRAARASSLRCSPAPISAIATNAAIATAASIAAAPYRRKISTARTGWTKRKIMESDSQS
ncbi:MAG: hypothetical protein WB697_21650 [Stellaceae bacterium]